MLRIFIMTGWIVVIWFYTLCPVVIGMPKGLQARMKCSNNKKCMKGYFCEPFFEECLECMRCAHLNRKEKEECGMEPRDCGECLEGYYPTKRFGSLTEEPFCVKASTTTTKPSVRKETKPKSKPTNPLPEILLSSIIIICFVSGVSLLAFVLRSYYRCRNPGTREVEANNIEISNLLPNYDPPSYDEVVETGNTRTICGRSWQQKESLQKAEPFFHSLSSSSEGSLLEENQGGPTTQDVDISTEQLAAIQDTSQLDHLIGNNNDQQQQPQQQRPYGRSQSDPGRRPLKKVQLKARAKSAPALNKCSQPEESPVEDLLSSRFSQSVACSSSSSISNEAGFSDRNSSRRSSLKRSHSEDNISGMEALEGDDSGRSPKRLRIDEDVQMIEDAAPQEDAPESSMEEDEEDQMPERSTDEEEEPIDGVFTIVFQFFFRRRRL